MKGIMVIFMLFSFIFNKLHELPSEKVEVSENIVEESIEEEIVIDIPVTEELVVDESTQVNKTVDTYPKHYEDETLSIEVAKEWYENSWCYIAHIKCDASRFQSCISSKGYGTTEKCSSVAKRENAILLINGDYYKPNYAPQMYLIRNKQILKDGTSDGYGIGFFTDGSLKPIEAGISANDTLNNGVIHSFMFGPTLVSNNVNVAKKEVSAPHTAIGMISPGEYYIVVSNGRYSDNESKGLNLYQLGNLFISKGCTFAYNLDGGGGSEMIFQGEILNSLSDGNERAAMDFIYFN